MKIWRGILGVLVLSLSIGMVFAQDEKPTVVATTTQVSDALNIIGGEYLNIIPLMGAGVDPHLYQPTEANIRAMQSADAVFYSGLFLEGKFDEVFQGLGERNIRIYAVSDPVDQAGFIFYNFQLNGETGLADPHFWFDPRNWQMSVEGMRDVLIELDPEHADEYEENAAEYVEQLDLLYQWGVEAMSEIPEAQRTLVTSHDAFQYFGDAFGWSVRGLQGISTEDEAGVADIQALVDYVIENEIPVMFIESSVPPNTIEAVQESVEARGGEIGIGVRVLYSDAMGDPESFGGTYVGMIASNIVTILQSFGYDIPEFPEDLEPAIPESLLELEEA